MKWISGKDKCAILYDGINQSGTVENISVGEFEHGKSTNANGGTVMILGDRSESVYVYPVRALDFQFFGLWTQAVRLNPSNRKSQFSQVWQVLVIMTSHFWTWCNRATFKVVLLQLISIILVILVLFTHLIMTMVQKICQKMTILLSLVLPIPSLVGNVDVQQNFLIFQNCNKLWTHQKI